MGYALGRCGLRAASCMTAGWLPKWLKVLALASVDLWKWDMHRLIVRIWEYLRDGSGESCRKKRRAESWTKAA